MHTVALIIKRARFFKRDIKSLVCEIFLPGLVVLAGLALMTQNYIYDSPEILIEPSIYNPPIESMWSGDPRAKALFERFPSEW